MILRYAEKSDAGKVTSSEGGASYTAGADVQSLMKKPQLTLKCVPQSQAEEIIRRAEVSGERQKLSLKINQKALLL